jgi:Uncharacterized protein conserved in bacteria (DUF2251)
MQENAPGDEFIVGEISPEGLVAFFEQDDATGYLYLADPDYKIREALHVYKRSNFSVREEQVQVIWSISGNKCGVLIAGLLRAVIGTNGDQYRPPMLSLDSEGVGKSEWTEGFEIGQ